MHMHTHRLTRVQPHTNSTSMCMHHMGVETGVATGARATTLEEQSNFLANTLRDASQQVQILSFSSMVLWGHPTEIHLPTPMHYTALCTNYSVCTAVMNVQVYLGSKSQYNKYNVQKPNLKIAKTSK